jgi:hypothetical protein
MILWKATDRREQTRRLQGRGWRRMDVCRCGGFSSKVQNMLIQILSRLDMYLVLTNREIGQIRLKVLHTFLRKHNERTKCTHRRNAGEFERHFFVGVCEYVDNFAVEIKNMEVQSPCPRSIAFLMSRWSSSTERNSDRGSDP